MNQKIKKNLHRSRRAVANYKERIVPTTLQKVGLDISRLLDQMNDPDFKDEKFRGIFKQTSKSSELYASNEEMFISFTIEWKGAMV